MSERGLGKKAAKRQANQQKDRDNENIFESKKFWYGLVIMFVVCGLGVIQFGLMLSDAFGKGAGAGAIVKLDVNDKEKLKEVFFSGEPSIIYCQDEKTVDLPIPKVVNEVAAKLSDDANFYHGDCFKPMPGSNKTIAARFDFGKNPAFIGVFANEEKPFMLNYFGSAKQVATQVRPKLKPSIKRVVYLKDWEVCKKRKTCLILGSKKPAQMKNAELAMKPHSKSFRKIKMISVDTAFYTLGLEEEFEKQEVISDEFGSAMCVTKVADKAESDMEGEKKDQLEKKKTQYIASWLSSWEGDVAGWLEECNNGGDPHSWYKLARRPNAKARPSETKHVKAPARKKEGGDEKDSDADAAEKFDGTKKGKEYIGRRHEEKPVEDDEEEEEAQGGEDEEEVEEEEL